MLSIIIRDSDCIHGVLEIQASSFEKASEVILAARDYVRTVYDDWNIDDIIGILPEEWEAEMKCPYEVIV